MLCGEVMSKEIVGRCFHLRPLEGYYGGQARAG